MIDETRSGEDGLTLAAFTTLYFAIQTCTVLSQLAEAMRVPSGDQAAAPTRKEGML